MSEKTETVKVALTLPKSVTDFFSAFAESNNTTLEILLVDELIDAVKMILDLDSKLKNLVIHQFGLEKILE